MILRSLHAQVLGLALAGSVLVTGCAKKTEAEPQAVAAAEAKPAEAAEAPEAAAPAAEAPKAAEAAAAAPAQGTAAPAAAQVAEATKAADPSEGCLYKEDGKLPEGCPHLAEAKPAAAAALVEGAPAGGCDSGNSVPTVTADGAHYGTPFTLTEAAPLATLAAKATEVADKTIQVSGTIDAVCQKKGCWMVVKDGETTARILMKDHAFTVPLDSKGKAAVVEGTLKVRTFTEAQVKHIEEDSGRDPSKVSGERQELVLTASAVKIKI